VWPKIIVKPEILSILTESLFSFVKWFPFLNLVNHFLSLSFSFSNYRATPGQPLNHPRTTLYHHWTTAKLVLGHRWTTSEPPQITPNHHRASLDYHRATSGQHRQPLIHPWITVKLPLATVGSSSNNRRSSAKTWIFFFYVFKLLFFHTHSQVRLFVILSKNARGQTHDTLQHAFANFYLFIFK